MNNKCNNVNIIEKVLEDNSLITFLESKLIIKTDTQRIELYLNQISNVRVFKKRNLVSNFIMFIVTGIFYLSIVAPKNENNIPTIFSILLFFILFTISCFLKNYNYTLLINKGMLGFYEIALSKKNIHHAENFVGTFKKNNLSKTGKYEFDYPKMKECL